MMVLIKQKRESRERLSPRVKVCRLEAKAKTELQNATRHFDIGILRKRTARHACIFDEEVRQVAGSVNAIARVRMVQEVISFRANLEVPTLGYVNVLNNPRLS